MTAVEWLEGSDPQALLESIGHELSAHKLRLFATACCRTIGNLLTTSQMEALDAAEQFADGRVTLAEMRNALLNALNQAASVGIHEKTDPMRAQTMRCLHTALYAPQYEDLYVSNGLFADTGIVAHYKREAFKRPFDYALYTSINVAHAYAAYAGVDESTNAQEIALGHVFRDHARLLKDIVSPHSHDIFCLTKGTGPDLTLLAASIYLNGSFHMVSRLATRMRERGLSHPAIDQEANSDLPHVRGTWLVDSVLGLD